MGSFSSSAGGTTKIRMPNERIFRSDEKPPKNPHEKGNQTFARIYANELASSEIKRAKPNFPIGSIIVREKLLKETDETPEVVTVMIKHEKGFSPKSGDWEFFVLQGELGKIKEQQTVGSCSKCHTQVKENDWVFRTYLKPISN